MSVVTRFPPSPTGHLHLGGARTALFNWLYARKNGGEMVLRIEDTDQARSDQEYIESILDSMKWLGLAWDSGPFYQTRRLERYHAVVEKLLEQGDAYYCFCSRERLDTLREAQRERGEKPRYDGHCRDRVPSDADTSSPVVRFRTPLEGETMFEDSVRGTVRVSNQELDDLVIARADGSPTYNLTVVVDDADMRISHVIRGEDHVSNTPRQIHIFRALGYELPVFAHVPMIQGPDGQRLSKRHGALSVLEYRDMGILPEALLNHLIRLGWSHGDQEIFSIDEMIELFDLNQVSAAPANFDMEKLLWINQHYIVRSDPTRLAREVSRIMNARGITLLNGPRLSEVVEVMRKRVRSLVEMADSITYLYNSVDEYDSEAITGYVDNRTSSLLAVVRRGLQQLEDWTSQEINQVIRQIVADEGVRFPEIAQPLRIAVSGSVATPSIDQTLYLVGRKNTLDRIDKAAEFFARNR